MKDTTVPNIPSRLISVKKCQQKRKKFAREPNLQFYRFKQSQLAGKDRTSSIKIKLNMNLHSLENFVIEEICCFFE